MASADLIRITGLWTKQTRSGTVLSGQLKPDARRTLLDTLAGEGDYEIVIFENQKRDKDPSPSHNLCLSLRQPRSSPHEPREAPASPQGQRERESSPREQPAASAGDSGADGDVMTPTWPERRPKPDMTDDDIPFVWLLPFILPAILFGSYV